MADIVLDDDDDDRDHAGAMIEWLKDKDPDVWFLVTQHLNWDSAMRVLDWIVSQPTCDKANAALVFWAADPLYYLSAMAEGRHRRSEGFDLLDKVLQQWKAGFYARAELAWPEDRRQKYCDALAKLPGKSDPLAIPGELLGPLKGRAPKVPDELRAENNVVLYDLLYRLGTMAGSRPGSPEWHRARDPEHRRRIEPTRQRAAVRQGSGNTLVSLGHTALWIVVPGLALFAAAFLLRWLIKGQLL